MVIYLEEAVERKRHEGGTLTITTCAKRDEGALLRLRPKLMTSRPSWRIAPDFLEQTVWDRR